LDTMSIAAMIGAAQIDEAGADLENQYYSCRRFSIGGTSIDYNSGTAAPAEGFDASHIALRDLTVGIDSVLLRGRDMKAVISEFSFRERSGLSVTSLTGSFEADSTVIRVPSLKLQTPHSEMDFTAQTYWELVDIPTTGRLTARFNAYIGKQDVLLFTGGLPDSFKDAYPFRPLEIHAGTEGNLKQMQLSRIDIDLPGAFSISGGGELWDLADDARRTGKIDLEMATNDLNFLTALSGSEPDGSIVVPDSMRLSALVTMEGPQYNASLNLQEKEGSLNLKADYNLSNDAYHADLAINSLQLHDFMPQDSIFTLTASLSARGQGVDFTAATTTAVLQTRLDELQYGSRHFSGVKLDGALKACVAALRLTVDNDLLKMQTTADLHLDKTYLDGKFHLNVDDVNLYELGIASKPLEHPFAFDLGAEARQDSIKLLADAGDLKFRFLSRGTLQQLVDQGSAFASLLMEQIDDRRLDHAALRRALPTAGLTLQAGKENPVSYFLATKGISYDKFRLDFGFTPRIGINGRSAIIGLHNDAMQLDTIFFTIRQDTAKMTLRAGVINGPDNPELTFKGALTGEIRNENMGLTVEYTNAEGETGILFGLNATPLIEGRGKGNGLLVNLVPEEPVIAFRKFHFPEEHNWIYMHKNLRVYANVDMESDDGLSFRLQSDTQDTLSLQNMNVELSNFQLEEISNMLPYLPHVKGLFTAKAHYIQTESSLQLSAGAGIKELAYEHQPVGDIGLGASWMPVDEHTHDLSAFFSYNGEQVLTADGVWAQRGGKDSLDLTASLNRFPLEMANAFVPDQMLVLKGSAVGSVSVKGYMDAPDIQGSLALQDSANVFITPMGARYWFDSRPITVADNKVTLDKFSIYTTSRNPFTIDGNVDFSNLNRPTADLTLNAENYTLLDAAHTRESLVYGKVVVDFNATAKGPLDALAIRGNMNLLGNTNVTYVLTNSPLTVEDRLDGLVTFVSFADTTSVEQAQVDQLPLGGLELNMSVHIDDAVRLRADLSADRSKYIELEGGGDLSLIYSAQGDMSLMGRYTLTGGVMRYSLPIIPLKDFEFTSGSYVDWRGEIMSPTLDLTATERIRSSVSDGDDDTSRSVNFEVSIGIKGSLDAPDLIFDIAAPEDATVENELQSMDADERAKQAIAMLATGIYLGSGGSGSLTMGAALNSVIQNQINSLAGGMKNASLSVGVEDRTSAETGDTQKDFSFRYSQRFFNDRVQIVIGGKVSTGSDATNNAESFIDNIS
ncbi:MAG: translocation/assembly module TamB domain-containing protein, partial [Prevotellaceae bacterium]|nr:translocation/assembly module TamB domain-containing protein [Prevotellaceae bacterium]